MLAGASSVVMPVDESILDMALDYESVAEKKAMLGSASVIVLDETVDLAWVTLKTTKFFKHESCGKCTPCREGTYWMLNILERVNRGEVLKADVDLLQNVASQIQNKCLCPLGEFSITPVLSSLKAFRNDFDAHTKDGAPKPAAKPAPAKPMAAKPAMKKEEPVVTGN
ncbi:MAG: NADH-ubiquinone oxidoreductase-F iron-sulfur binding region domain-containing protein [Anaerolineales bacterium]